MKTRLVFLFLSAAVIGRRNFAQIQFSLAVEVVEIPLRVISIPIFNPNVFDRFWVGSFHAERAAAVVMVVVLLLVVVLLQVIVLVLVEGNNNHGEAVSGLAYIPKRLRKIYV